jgi:hypothetical protein
MSGEDQPWLLPSISAYTSASSAEPESGAGRRWSNAPNSVSPGPRRYGFSRNGGYSSVTRMNA